MNASDLKKLKEKYPAVEWRKADDLHLHEKNPRLIKEQRFQLMIKSITEFPNMLMVRPIVINEEGIVIGGNMRLRAAKAAGWKEVPVSVAYGFSEEQEREFIIKDNATYGDWDWEMLGNYWDDIPQEDWGLNINFEVPYQPEYEPDIDAPEVTEADMTRAEQRQEAMGDTGMTETLTVACPHCGEEFEINKP